MIKIAVAYGNLLNMYGDYANVDVLVRYLREAGFLVETSFFSINSYLDLSAHDMLYIGAGTERRMLKALEDFKRFFAELRAFANDGKFVLATGNSVALLGRSVTDYGGITREGAGLLDVDTALMSTRTYSELVLHSNMSKTPVVGGLNTSLTITSREQPFFDVVYTSARTPLKNEGALKRTVFATELSGPLLVRNPGLLHGFAELVSDKKFAQSNELWVQNAAESQRRVLLKLQRKMKG